MPQDKKLIVPILHVILIIAAFAAMMACRGRAERSEDQAWRSFQHETTDLIDHVGHWKVVSLRQSQGLIELILVPLDTWTVGNSVLPEPDGVWTIQITWMNRDFDSFQQVALGDTIFISTQSYGNWMSIVPRPVWLASWVIWGNYSPRDSDDLLTVEVVESSARVGALPHPHNPTLKKQAIYYIISLNERNYYNL